MSDPTTPVRLFRVSADSITGGFVGPHGTTADMDRAMLKVKDLLERHPRARLETHYGSVSEIDWPWDEEA
jgi:hypothetical protein